MGTAVSPHVQVAPYCQAILLRALDAELPGIQWFRCGPVVGTETRYECLSFGEDAVLSLPPGRGLDWLDAAIRELPTDQPTFGGYAAALTYEAGWLCDEAIAADDRIEGPAIRLVRLDAVYITDHKTGTAEIQYSADASASRRSEFERRIVPLCAQVARKMQTPPIGHDPATHGELSAEEYQRSVAGLKEAIIAGEFYECNYTQRFRVSSSASPEMVARGLFAGSMSRHAAYMDLGSEVIISNSPEQFLRVQETHIETSPIKGSIARSPDATKDADAYRRLSQSAKDYAEHTMVVDMARNDLGRICRAGSVRVARPYVLESHRDLHHLVSTVEGELQPNLSVSDILRATFPAASITGAPKIAAVRAIRQSEKSPRGIYTGALGLIGRGGMELNVAIRTVSASRTGERFDYEFGAGGAVVADSDPQAEYLECLQKARAVHHAICSAERLLQQ